MSRLPAPPPLVLREFDPAGPAPLVSGAAPLRGGVGPSAELVPLFATRDTEPRETVLALLAHAREEAFRAGWEAGQTAAVSAHEAALRSCLDAVSAGLREAAAAARTVTEGVADALAATLVEALGAALPSLGSRLGAAESARFASSLLPALAAEPHVEIAVAPELVAALAERLASERQVNVVADALLAPGDVRLRWHDGEASRHAAEAHRAIVGEIAALALPQQAADAPFEPAPARPHAALPQGANP